MRSSKAVGIASLLLFLSSQSWIVYARTVHTERHLPVLPPLPPLPAPASALDKIAAELWLRSRSQLQFCFGNSRQRAEDLMRESFALPWPAGDDGICSSAEEVEKKLCTPDDMMFYYKYILRSDNPEKIPDSAECTSGGASHPACAPGFFEMDPPYQPPPPSARSALSPDTAELSAVAQTSSSWRGSNFTDDNVLSAVHACCEGYFCPTMLRCMLPCPRGAYCPGAVAAPAPKAFASDSVNRWCAPYAYKERKPLGCGGADKWPLEATAAFPGVPWDAGSGSIFCNAGFFCPNVTSQVPCPEGHYCKRGSTAPRRCPPLTRCPPGSEVPSDTYTGMLVDAVLFALLWVLWRLSKWANHLARWLARRRRLRDYMPKSLSPASSTAEKQSQGMEALFGSQTSAAASELPSSGLQHWASFAGPRDSRSPRTSGTLTGAAIFNGASECGIPPTRVRLDVEFHSLSLRLRGAAQRRVLESVSGRLRAARLTAIMGPSGAGKTSLMSALASRAAYGTVSGVVLVNGQRTALDRYSKVTGFVPQDDILLPLLTVEESLLFSARRRLPASYTADQHVSHVEDALQVLQLKDVRYELIGDEEARGLSGGQRKRVNVGVELVADPGLLFLDEPTSGLDSTASKLVIAALQQVAHGGVTVAAVIHQPSHLVLSMFDDLLLLGKGGRTVYYGPQLGVQGYFESLGYELPSQANPADVYMDIIGGLVQPSRSKAPLSAVGHESASLASQWRHFAADSPELQPPHDIELELASASASSGFDSDFGDEEEDGWQSSVARLFRRTVSHVQQCVPAAICAAVHRLRQFRRSVTAARRFWHQAGPAIGTSREALLAPASDSDEQNVQQPNAAARQLPGFLRQFRWCIGRAAVQRTREPLAVFTDYAVFALTGMALGTISERGKGTIVHYTVEITYNNVALGLMASVTALRTFSRGRLVYQREASTGLHKLAYFVAEDTFGHIGSLVRSLVYLVMYYTFAQPRAVAAEMYLVTAGIVYCCTGTAYFLSQVMEPAPAQLAAAVMALLNTLIARSKDSTGLVWLFYQLSYSHWALEAYVIAEANRLTDLQGLGYSVTEFWFCLGMLFAIGLGFRVGACASMLYRR